MLEAVEAVAVQKGLERSRLAVFDIVSGRQQVVEQRVDHARIIRTGAARGGEALQFGTAHGRQSGRFGADQRGHLKRVIASGH